jgi:hypothetical protein
MAKKRHRDYAAEYRLRIERALAKGLSRSQARGHRKPSEALITKNRAQKALEDHRLQLGLRFFRKEKNFAKAAKEAGLSVERLRTEAIERGVVEKRGHRWFIKRDLPRRVPIFTDGREKIITVGDFDEASLVGKYMSAVGWFLRTNEVRHLRPYTERAVTDIAGDSHPLETRPNVLHRLANAGVSSFEQVYRIVV